MAGGLLWFSAWRYQQIPEHKLNYIGLLVTREEDAAQPDSARIGFRLKNNSIYPVQIYIDELKTCVANRVNSERYFEQRLFVLDAGADFSFNDAVIKIDGIKDEIMNGTVDFKINYGRVGRRKFVLEKSLNVSIPKNRLLPFTQYERPNDDAKKAAEG
jgi:hypothetical protein